MDDTRRGGPRRRPHRPCRAPATPQSQRTAPPRRSDSRISANRRRYPPLPRPPRLVAQKLELLDLPEVRLRAKDRYDLAWWLSERIEHVAPSLRIALDRRLANDPSLRDLWDRAHQADPFYSPSTPIVVHGALTSTLDRDPVVLADRWPEGTLILHIDEGPSTSLSFKPKVDKPGELQIASFRNDQELERFMRRLQLWRPDDIPEQLKEITLERERAIVFARSRSRQWRHRKSHTPISEGT